MSETKKWNPEAVATLMNIVGTERPVSAELVAAAAETLEVTPRSISAKLRNLDIDVASLAVAKESKFSPEESDSLAKFVVDNSGQLTYKDISEQFAEAKFSAKQIQGKVLALELTSHVKPTEKVEVARQYSDAEQDQFIALAKAGKFIEEIAAALGKTVASVRGKALSLTRTGAIDKIPAQKESHANVVQDPIEALGDAIAKMTVAEIAAAVDKTERGVKTILTRRGIDVADYKGVAKKEKAEAKTTAKA